MAQPTDVPIAWEFRHPVFKRGDSRAIASIRRRAVRQTAIGSGSSSPKGTGSKRASGGGGGGGSHSPKSPLSQGSGERRVEVLSPFQIAPLQLPGSGPGTGTGVGSGPGQEYYTTSTSSGYASVPVEVSYPIQQYPAPVSMPPQVAGGAVSTHGGLVTSPYVPLSADQLSHSNPTHLQQPEEHKLPPLSYITRYEPQPNYDSHQHQQQQQQYSGAGMRIGESSSSMTPIHALIGSVEDHRQYQGSIWNTPMHLATVGPSFPLNPNPHLAHQSRQSSFHLSEQY